MTPHVTKNDLTRLRSRTLTPEENLAVLRHLESCPECAATAVDAIDPRTVAESWSSTLHATLGDHLRGDELSDYVDGSLTPAALRDAEAHLEHCAVCREDAADLRRLAGRRPSWRRVVLSVAAGIIVVIGLGISVRRATTASPREVTLHPPAKVSPSHAHADPSLAAWRALVDAAVSNGEIAPPALLATLQMPGDVMRGDGARQASAAAPNGVVIEDTHPTFRWSGSPGAVYTVSILDGDREAARSAPLRSNVWTPEPDLARGRTYRWQVEARRGKETWIIPPAPLSAPVFALLDDSAHRDLESARRSHPDDHLLLGVLAAHYGLQEEAIAELTRHQSAHSDASSTALLDSVRAWRKGEGL